jgi:hypothetical protein
MPVNHLETRLDAYVLVNESIYKGYLSSEAL